ncbi:MAG: cell division protein SepF [Candidatus Gastranaerophilales bacterium]|nr:cell division protein SepF [Candidatus Gastranaerophilales bacterium]
MTIQDTFSKLTKQFMQAFDGEETMEEDTPQALLPYETKGTLALDNNMTKTNVKTPETKVITPAAFNSNNTEVIICEPRKYSESVEFVKYLRDKKSIIVNISLLDGTEACRIVDFLCGAAHALSGNMNKISDNVYIFTPVNVTLSAESQSNKMVKDVFWE